MKTIVFIKLQGKRELKLLTFFLSLASQSAMATISSSMSISNGINAVPRMVPPPLSSTPDTVYPTTGGLVSPTSPMVHPTSPGSSTSVYRGFPSLKDRRSAPYPTSISRFRTLSHDGSYPTLPSNQ